MEQPPEVEPLTIPSVTVQVRNSFAGLLTPQYSKNTYEDLLNGNVSPISRANRIKLKKSINEVAGITDDSVGFPTRMSFRIESDCCKTNFNNGS